MVREFTLEEVFGEAHLCFTENGVKYGIRVFPIPTEEDIARNRCLEFVRLKFGHRPEFIEEHDARKDWSGFVDSAGDLKRGDLVSAVRGFYA